MRQAVLLGNAGTKRTEFFRQAAKQEKLPVLFVDWKDYGKWKEQLSQGEWLIKIDPPLWDSFSLGELDRLVRDYEQKLYELSQMAQMHRLEFFNDPLVIAQLLDKRACKKRLEQAGLAVTKLLEDHKQSGKVQARHEQTRDRKTDASPDVLTDRQKKTDSQILKETDRQEKTDSQILKEIDEQEKMNSQMLIEMMRRKGVYQVFIKPVRGSGAAGVSAFRVHPSASSMVLYTCALEHPEYGLVNTKCLRRFSGQEEICALLDRILELDCVIERWYAKAEYQGYAYDLRAVVLDGRLEFLLGRLSKGPVTNLHLNNHPVEAAALGIADDIMDEIAVLCKEAVDCFPGLRCAGIDILLEKGSLRPRVIEMNAQGDLIYQDIFHENRIYRREAEMMISSHRT